MSASIQAELSALGERWRARARKFMAEAEQSTRSADIISLTAMASTLEWAAGDLSIYTRIECSDDSLVAAKSRENPHTP